MVYLDEIINFLYSKQFQPEKEIREGKSSGTTSRPCCVCYNIGDYTTKAGGDERLGQRFDWSRAVQQNKGEVLKFIEKGRNIHGM